MFKVERAVRSQAKARIALVAASGGGKTYSALLLAKGIVEYMIEAGLVSGTLEGKIGVVDTERKSASLYAHLLPFDVINLEAPYTTARYKGAISALENAGNQVIVVDQISHAWAGAGGLLETVDKIKAQSHDQFSAWKDVTPEQNEFIEFLLACRAHLIVSMRAKSAYVMEEYTDRQGNRKHKPKRIGLAPVQRAGIEYEFTTVMDIEVGTNLATSTKDRTSLFVDQSVRLNEEWGKKLAHWLYAGQAQDEGVDRRSALEKAQAIAGAGCRACDRAPTIPDLARVFEVHRKQLLAFRGEVPDDQLVPLNADLVGAKDRRKAALALPESTPLPADAIDVEDALALEEWCRRADGCGEAFLVAFKIPRFGYLDAARLQEAADWIQHKVQLSQNPDGIPVPARLAGRLKVLPVSAFADLGSDPSF